MRLIAPLVAVILRCLVAVVPVSAQDESIPVCPATWQHTFPFTGTAPGWSLTTLSLTANGIVADQLDPILNRIGTMTLTYSFPANTTLTYVGSYITNASGNWQGKYIEMNHDTANRNGCGSWYPGMGNGCLPTTPNGHMPLYWQGSLTGTVHMLIRFGANQGTAVNYSVTMAGTGDNPFDGVPCSTSTQTPTPTPAVNATPTPTPTVTATPTATEAPYCILVTRAVMTRTEGEEGQNYGVRLSRAPAAGEIVRIVPSSTSDQFTITPEQRWRRDTNWSNNITFTVTAIDNTLVDGTRTGTINHTASSNVPGSPWNGAPQCRSITVTIRDNELTPTATPTATATATVTPTPTAAVGQVALCPIGEGISQGQPASAMGNNMLAPELLESSSADVCQTLQFNVLNDCIGIDVPVSPTSPQLSITCPDWDSTGTLPQFNLLSEGSIVFQLINPYNASIVAEAAVTCPQGINHCSSPDLQLPFQVGSPNPTAVPTGSSWSYYFDSPAYPLDWRAIVPANAANLIIWGDSLDAYLNNGTSTPPPVPVYANWDQPAQGRDNQQGEECHPNYMDALGNILDTSFQWWRVMTHNQNDPRPVIGNPNQAHQSHHPIQDLWVRTIFEDVYVPSVHRSRAPTILMPTTNHRATFGANLESASEALSKSWSGMWNEAEFANYAESGTVNDYSSVAFRMFALSNTPRRCVELYKERLKRFMTDLVCRAVVNESISAMPPQVGEVKVWLENELGYSLTSAVCSSLT